MSNDYIYDDGNHVIIDSKNISSPAIKTDALTIGTTTVVDVSQSKTDSSTRTIVSSYALSSLGNDIYKRLEQIDPNNNLFVDNSVVTLPIVPRVITSDHWDILGWEETSNKRYKCTGSADTNLSNSISIKNSPFSRTGAYFINIGIDVLDSGELCVYDQSNNLLATATAPGNLAFIFNVELPMDAAITIRSKNTLTNEVVIITAVDIYFATSRIQQFLAYYIPTVLTSGSKFVSEDEVSNMLNAMYERVEAMFNDFPDANVLNSIENHVKTTGNNVHQETPESIGAASKNHTHTPASIGAASSTHTHTAHDVGAAEEHHSHIPADIGAASADHTHTPSSIGAAATVHDHPEYLLRSEYTGSGSGAVQAAYAKMILTDRDVTDTVLSYLGNVQFTSPILSSPRLIHKASNNTDFNSGIATSNTKPVDGSYIYNAFKFTNDNTVCTTFNVTPTDSAPVTLGYIFSSKKMITGYAISYKAGTGYPTKWTVRFGNSSISTVSAPTYTNNMLRVPVVTSLVSNDIYFDFQNATLVSGSWTVHVIVEFADSTTALCIIEGSEKRVIACTKTGGLMATYLSRVNVPADATAVEGSVRYPYIDNETTTEYGYTKCAPEYGYRQSGYEPFDLIKQSSISTKSDGVLDSVTVGNAVITCTSTDLLSGMDIKYLFTAPKPFEFKANPSYTTGSALSPIIPVELQRTKTAAGIKSFTTKITGLSHNFKGWKLVVANDDVANLLAPTSITVNYSTSTKDYTGYNGTNTPPVPATDKFGNTILSGTIDATGLLTYKATIVTKCYDYYTDVDNDLTFFNDYNTMSVGTSPIPDVTALEITFTNNHATATSMAIAGFRLFMCGDYYKPVTNTMVSPAQVLRDKRIYLGKCVFEKDLIGVLPVASSIGAGTSTRVFFNIDGDSSNKTIEIFNPYFSTDISIEPINENAYNFINGVVDGSLVNLGISPTVLVKSITCEKIILVVQSGLRGIKISRLW